jgi:ABC-type polysaccharide/polyol phosphate export permease
MYAWRDFSSAFGNIRSWSYLAAKQLQFDHRRTVLGSLWIVFAFALTAGSIGALLGALQGRPLDEHVPYVMFGFTAWNFVSGVVTEGCNVLTKSRAYLLQMPLPRTVFVISMVLRRGMLMLIHAVTSVAVCALFFGWRPSVELIWLPAALAIYFVAGVGVATALGMIVAMLRDIGELVAAVMRLAFFFTPIIWLPGARDTNHPLIEFVVTWNPFAYVLEVFRSPALGAAPEPMAWAVTGGLALFALVLGAAALEIWGKRITYWL